MTRSRSHFLSRIPFPNTIAILVSCGSAAPTGDRAYRRIRGSRELEEKEKEKREECEEWEGEAEP